MAGGLDMQSPRRGQYEQGCEKSPLLAPRSPLIVLPSCTPASSTSIRIERVSLQALMDPEWNNNSNECEKISILRCTSTTSTATTKGYGTMTLTPDREANRVFGSAVDRPEVVDSDGLHREISSNQSETESESDTCSSSGCSLLTLHQKQPLQSILRIPSRGIHNACALPKKQSSVVFAIEIMSDSDEENDEAGSDDPMHMQRRQQKENSTIYARCFPRRLTIAEKAELYRVRPDLEHMPTAFQAREQDERRRQKQRRLVFSGLAGSLLLFLIIVLYYVLAQM